MQRSARPWLSVVMPTRDGGPFVRRAIASILSQRDSGVELIVVDDNSQDSTSAILDSCKLRLRMCIMRAPVRGNWVASTNVALRHVRGQYVCWLHQDDEWCPGRLSLVRRLLAKQSWPDVLIHPTLYIDRYGRTIGRLPLPLQQCPHGHATDICFRRLLVQNWIAPSAPVMSVSAVRSIGPLDEELWYTADWDYWLRLSRVYSVAVTHHPVVRTRIHGSSQTLCRMTCLSELRRQYDAVLSRHLQFVRGDASRTIRCLAELSKEINIAFASVLLRRRVDARLLASAFLRVPPICWWQFIRDSQVAARTLARVRAGLLTERGRCADAGREAGE